MSKSSASKETQKPAKSERRRLGGEGLGGLPRPRQRRWWRVRADGRAWATSVLATNHWPMTQPLMVCSRPGMGVPRPGRRSRHCLHQVPRQ